MKRLQKLEILLDKVAKNVGLVENESSSEDVESDYVAGGGGGGGEALPYIRTRGRSSNIVI